MSDLKPTGEKITLGGKEYGMRFTLNAIDDIQEHFDVPIAQLADVLMDEKKQIKNIRYLLTLLINEDIDCLNDDADIKTPRIDEKYLGRHMDTTNMHELIGTILKVFSAGMPKPDDEDDENPNA